MVKRQEEEGGRRRRDWREEGGEEIPNFGQEKGSRNKKPILDVNILTKLCRVDPGPLPPFVFGGPLSSPLPPPSPSSPEPKIKKSTKRKNKSVCFLLLAPPRSFFGPSSFSSL
jgi:hypothetical protein